MIPSVADVLGSMHPRGVVDPRWRRILDYAFTSRSDGRLPFHAVVLGTPKKEGRSSVLAAIATWALRHVLPPNGDLLIIGSSTDSIPGGRVWQPLRAAVESELRDDGRSRLRMANGATAWRVYEPVDVGKLPAPRWVICDDLWKFGESWRDCWGGLAGSLRVVSSYAGSPGSSPLLEDLCRHGARLPRAPEFDDLRGLDDEPVVRADHGSLFSDESMLFYWDTVHRAPWVTSEQGQAYLVEQKRRLPPSEYLRLHHNQWCLATAEKP